MAVLGSLHKAVLEGDAELVQTLLLRRASANVIEKGGKWGPLHLAAGQGQLRIVEALLSGKADVAVCDADGRTAADWAASTAHHRVKEVLSRHARLSEIVSCTSPVNRGGATEPLAGPPVEPLTASLATRSGLHSSPFLQDFAQQSPQNYESSCHELGQRLAATAHREGVLAQQLLQSQEENRHLRLSRTVGCVGSGLFGAGLMQAASPYNLDLRVAALEEELRVLRAAGRSRQEEGYGTANGTAEPRTHTELDEAVVSAKKLQKREEEAGLVLRHELDEARAECQEALLCTSSSKREAESEVEAMRRSLLEAETRARDELQTRLEQLGQEKSRFAETANEEKAAQAQALEKEEESQASRVRLISEEAAAEIEELRKEVKAAKAFVTDEASLCATVKRQLAQEEEEAKALQVQAKSLKEEVASAHEEANQANARAAAAARAWGR